METFAVLAPGINMIRDIAGKQNIRRWKMMSLNHKPQSRVPETLGQKNIASEKNKGKLKRLLYGVFSCRAWYNVIVKIAGKQDIRR